MRKIVRTQPVIIFAAEQVSEAKICVPSKKLNGNPNDSVLIYVGPADVVPVPTKVGDPMPFDCQYSVFVPAGQVVWASSPGEALMTIVVFPWRT